MIIKNSHFLLSVLCDTVFLFLFFTHLLWKYAMFVEFTQYLIGPTCQGIQVMYVFRVEAPEFI